MIELGGNWVEARTVGTILRLGRGERRAYGKGRPVLVWSRALRANGESFWLVWCGSSVFDPIQVVHAEAKYTIKTCRTDEGRAILADGQDELNEEFKALTGRWPWEVER